MTSLIPLGIKQGDWIKYLEHFTDRESSQSSQYSQNFYKLAIFRNSAVTYNHYYLLPKLTKDKLLR